MRSAVVPRFLLKNKIPERGSAGFARAPSLWNFIYLLPPKSSNLSVIGRKFNWAQVPL